MNYITLGFAPSDGEGRSELIKHGLWVKGLNPDLLHAFLVVNDVAFEMCYEGVFEISDLDEVHRLTQSAKSNYITAAGFPDWYVGHILERFEQYPNKTKGVTHIDTFRAFFDLPPLHDTCYSFVGKLLGGNVNTPKDLTFLFMYAAVELSTYLYAPFIADSLEKNEKIPLS